MLKRLTLILSLAAVAVIGHAETHYEPHIAVGVHTGVDASRVSFTPAIQQNWLPGAVFGVSASYSEEKLVGLMAEINYEQRGWNEKFETAPLTYKRSLHYISVPVMTHIHFGGPRAKCIVNLGPQFSFLLGQSTSSNFDYTKPMQDENWPTDERRMTQQYTMQVDNKFDYGICAGAGFEFYTSPRNSVNMELRYYFGLGNIFPSTKADTFSASRNMSLALTLGYNFRLR